jgi:hypothetical protein
MPRFDRPLKPCKLYLDSRENGVRTSVTLEDGAFIADLCGFLEHIDEVKCDDGIPRSCLLVTDTDLVVDMDGTPFTFAKQIRRSFHFNCIVRLMRVDGEPRVGLFATKLKGPLTDEKARRGQAIREGGELFLPFDGEIPFPVEEIQWKDRKLRPRAPPKEVKLAPELKISETQPAKTATTPRSSFNTAEWIPIG